MAVALGCIALGLWHNRASHHGPAWCELGKPPYMDAEYLRIFRARFMISILASLWLPAAAEAKPSSCLSTALQENTNLRQVYGAAIDRSLTTADAAVASGAPKHRRALSRRFVAALTQVAQQRDEALRSNVRLLRACEG